MSDQGRAAQGRTCLHYSVGWDAPRNAWWCIDCGQNDLLVIEGPPVTNAELRKMIEEAHRD